MFLGVLLACHGRDTDSPAGGSDTEVVETGDATCPPEDGGGFFSGGLAEIAPSGTVYPTWDRAPSPVGGSACIDLEPDQNGFMFTWISGSFWQWNETRWDYDDASQFFCTLSGEDFTCTVGHEKTVEFEGVSDARVTMSQGVTGTWAEADHLTGQEILSVTCDGAGCEAAAVDVGWNPPVFDTRIEFAIDAHVR